MTSCVEVHQVHKSFGENRALAGLSFTAEAGRITSVLGPNGAGKSTAMSICEGLQRADSGQVRVLGMDPAEQPALLRPRVGVMIQDGGLPVMARAEELLRHVGRMYARPRSVDDLIETLGLAPFARTSVRRLSGGQRQRLAMAIALVGRPDLVFLDEPSAGLDPQARLAVWAMIDQLRADGVSVVLTTHLMDEAARLSDHVVIIDHGQVIAQGSVADLTGAPATDQPEDTAAASGLVLSGTITAEVRTAVEDLARTHQLTVHPQPGSAAAAPGATPASRHTLEDVFLQLTGRSLR
ncbi:MAG TPA: ABC transporter ATP-binding protein [Ruania sp.]|nr:ABC transporter ATP-binding protein [Ruania sp.]